MAKQIDSEPIQVNLGEEFNPFLGMKKLRTGETPDVIGRSRIFNLEGIGQGEIRLGNSWYDIEDIKGNYLSIPKDRAKLMSAKKFLKSSVAYVLAEIYPFSPNLSSQPDIKCISRVGDIELYANNINIRESLEESAFFYSFVPQGRSKGQDLLVPPKLSFLKDLSFRFEPK